MASYGSHGDVRHFFPHKLHWILSSLYALSKVQGWKRIKKLLLHGVDDVDQDLWALWFVNRLSPPSSMKNAAAAVAEEEEAKPWESAYVLLSWLNALSLIYFRLDVIDSFSSLALVVSYLG